MGYIKNVQYPTQQRAPNPGYAIGTLDELHDKEENDPEEEYAPNSLNSAPFLRMFRIFARRARQICRRVGFVAYAYLNKVEHPLPSPNPGYVHVLLLLLLTYVIQKRKKWRCGGSSG